MPVLPPIVRPQGLLLGTTFSPNVDIKPFPPPPEPNDRDMIHIRDQVSYARPDRIPHLITSFDDADQEYLMGQQSVGLTADTLEKLFNVKVSSAADATKFANVIMNLGEVLKSGNVQGILDIINQVKVDTKEESTTTLALLISALGQDKIFTQLLIEEQNIYGRGPDYFRIDPQIIAAIEGIPLKHRLIGKISLDQFFGVKRFINFNDIQDNPLIVLKFELYSIVFGYNPYPILERIRQAHGAGAPIQVSVESFSFAPDTTPAVAPEADRRRFSRVQSESIRALRASVASESGLDSTSLAGSEVIPKKRGPGRPRGSASGTPKSSKRLTSTRHSRKSSP